MTRGSATESLTCQISALECHVVPHENNHEEDEPSMHRKVYFDAELIRNQAILVGSVPVQAGFAILSWFRFDTKIKLCRIFKHSEVLVKIEKKSGKVSAKANFAAVNFE
jgi:hypothetical protein